jgi:hypothetical protein
VKIKIRIKQFALPLILINGLAFVLMIVFGKVGGKGILSFANAFNISVILSFLLIGILSIKDSISIMIEFVKNKRYGLMAGQIGITLFILLVAGSLTWGMFEAILKSAR